MKTLARFHVCTLLLSGLAHATTFAAIATDEPIQINYVYRLLEVAKTDPNVPALEALGLPVLSAIKGDPNAWTVPCGPWRRQGTFWDKEGYDVRIEVLAADLPCEVTVSPADRTWTLTVPDVSPGWHVVTVRVTDIPPPQRHHRPASRDVAIAFAGVAGPNEQPGLD